MPHEMDASEMRKCRTRMDASEMRKMGNPTCMHVGDDETTRHNSASEMRDTRRKRPHTEVYSRRIRREIYLIPILFIIFTSKLIP